MDNNVELLEFIDKSKSQFHLVDEMKTMLLKAGFTELKENEKWEEHIAHRADASGGKFFVTRNDSAIIAFEVGNKLPKCYQMVAAHSDSPTFRIKENPELKAEKYVRLNVEKYGGALMAPWFDRPLSIAGRVLVAVRDGVESRLIDFDRDLCMLPSLCIHFNREANDGYKYSVQKDMLPLISMREDFSLKQMVASELGVATEEILDMDLFLYNRDKGYIWGADGEFLSARRLDDQACVFAGLKGLLETEPVLDDVCRLLCVFDNEEVGSGTRQGAMATFLYDTLIRINEAFGGSYSDYLMALADSFMISADNAQASHPNYMEKSCPTNKVFLNDGLVIKYSANQKYTTDAVSGARFKKLCMDNGILFQVFHNNSDVLGGSTLGNLSATNVSVPSVDIGLPQLAMHSPFETCGSRDLDNMLSAMTAFYRHGA